MRAEDVAQYLQNNPQFFEDHADMLAQINLPHPHGGRTISLSERQIACVAREEQGAGEKAGRTGRVRRGQRRAAAARCTILVALFAARDLITLQEMIPHLLREIFAIPHAVLRLWKVDPPSAEVLGFTDAQAQPVCLHHAAHDTAAWFGEARVAIAFLRLSAVACRQRDHRLAGARQRRQTAFLPGNGHGVPGTHRRSGSQRAASLSGALMK